MPLTIDARAYDLNAKSSRDLPGINPVTDDAALGFAAADSVFLVPFTVTRTFTAQRMLALNGTTANGNTRMGIYSRTGALLASTAATAMSGTSIAQIIALSASVTLAPGLYFMALSNSGTTARYASAVAGGQSVGLNATALGCRATVGGGIVTSPTIADVTTSSVTDANLVPIMSVLGFDADELVA